MDVKVNLKMKFTFDKLLKNIYKKPINQFNPMTNKKKTKYNKITTENSFVFTCNSKSAKKKVNLVIFNYHLERKKIFFSF